MKDVASIKKLLYVIIFLLICNMIVTVVVNEKEEKAIFDVSSFEEIKLKDLKKYIDDDNYHLVVIGESKCEYTAAMVPILKKASREFNYETLYVDYKKVSDDDLKVLLEYDDEYHFIEKYFGETPFMIVFKNNKMQDTWVGYEEYATFASFLTDLGIEKK